MPITNLDGALIEDQWLVLEEETDVPSGGDVIVPLEVAAAKAERLSNHSGRIGLAIPNDVNVEDYAALIKKADLVLLALPGFADGRAYSQARQLREVLGFDKELRIKGDVLPDQAAFLLRCGFDTFDADRPIDETIWQKSISQMSTSYQRNYRDDLANRSIS